jgi:hypothetical protein
MPRGDLKTVDVSGSGPRMWRWYECRSCGGMVMTMSKMQAVGKYLLAGKVEEMWPSRDSVASELPERARTFLTQAIECLHSPVPSIIAANAAIDAMFKGKGLREGSLYARIEKAAQDHLITEEMKAWAHDVRLDANDQRHADEDEPLPSRDDASKCVEFAKALGQFLYVLPARVARGRGK